MTDHPTESNPHADVFRAADAAAQRLAAATTAQIVAKATGDREAINAANAARQAADIDAAQTAAVARHLDLYPECPIDVATRPQARQKYASDRRKEVAPESVPE